jgi:bifunctional non-homologous end joining protein LigD
MAGPKPRARARAGERLVIPSGASDLVVRAGRRNVRLSSLSKVYFPEAGITKRDLLQYYADVAEVLVPHLRDRAMVMKRYPNGIHGKSFFMKRTPAGAPDWVRRCEIEHASGNVIDFPVVDDRATLLWIVNLGCIDLNPWYSRCGDVQRPEYLNFDLDPVPPAGFEEAREVALLLREALDRFGARAFVKTSGSRGFHLYVPILHGPPQKRVWAFAKSLALELQASSPRLVTAEYRIAKRPAGRVLVDYNQNAWGRTLASAYSVRPRPAATVSAPVTWEEVEGGIGLEDLTLRSVPSRLREAGDLWRPLLYQRGRFDLEAHGSPP